MKKWTIIYITIAVVAIGTISLAAYYCYQTQINKNTTNNVEIKDEKNSANNEISYKGKTNTTALSLLEKNAEIKTSGSGKNAFVTTINGVTANPKNQYWAFYINGKSATVGAGSYITKDSDTIIWKLSSF